MLVSMELETIVVLHHSQLACEIEIVVQDRV